MTTMCIGGGACICVCTCVSVVCVHVGEGREGRGDDVYIVGGMHEYSVVLLRVLLSTVERSFSISVPTRNNIR